MSTKDFYRAFEEKHRGSRKLIKERISIYLPFVLPLKDIYPDLNSLDIGCGRGEWLELLKEHHIPAQGIDLDEGMLEACHSLGLDVQNGEGITYLQSQSDESMTMITAFHVVEHISFEDLQCLIEEALRVLVPGGLLIMETPNPENIKVGTENFYLDPTHIKPIPSGLLSFLPEYYGYERTKILRLQEQKDLYSKNNVSFIDIMGGVSPDYAVLAQKNANKDILKPFDTIFSKEFGLSLSTLTDKFESRLVATEKKANQAESKATQAESKAIQAESKAIQAESKAIQAESKAIQAETRTNDTLQQYHAVTTSNSWKMTKPLRHMRESTQWFTTGVKHWVTFSPTSRPRRVVKKSLILSKEYMNAHPKLKQKIITILEYFPSLKNKIHYIMAPLPNISPKKPKNMVNLLKIKTEIEAYKQSRISL